MKLFLDRNRKSLTAMDDAEIDHSVWMDIPMFATVGVSQQANTFYKNKIHQSLKELKKRGETSENIQEVIEFYEESRFTACLLVNVVQGLMHSIMFGWSIG